MSNVYRETPPEVLHELANRYPVNPNSNASILKAWLADCKIGGEFDIPASANMNMGSVRSIVSKWNTKNKTKFRVKFSRTGLRDEENNRMIFSYVVIRLA